jgi:hypothetical protein
MPVASCVIERAQAVKKHPLSRIPQSNKAWRRFLVERGLATAEQLIRARLNSIESHGDDHARHNKTPPEERSDNDTDHADDTRIT